MVEALRVLANELGKKDAGTPFLHRESGLPSGSGD